MSLCLGQEFICYSCKQEYSVMDEHELGICTWCYIKQLQAENERLHHIKLLVKRYLEVKKSWDNRLTELIELKKALKEK